MIIATVYLAAASALGCRVVEDDVIRMHDLAAVEPAFAPVDADSVVGYSPMPGAVRVMQGVQLRRLAKRYEITDREFRDVCFQRAMRQLGEGELQNTLLHALGIPGAEIQLADFSRFPAPVGELVFPRSGLAITTSQASWLWKGYVIYGSGHHFPVWARVNVRAKLNRVVATDNLVTSKPVRADQVRIEALDGVPDAIAPAQSLDQVVGKTLLQPVRRGATISLDDISSAIVVRRGDKVEVDLESPVVRLRFQAAAEMDGRFGDRIRLRNLQSNNIFVAEVLGKDQARVVLETNADEINHAGVDLRPAGDSGGGSSGQEEKGYQ